MSSDLVESPLPWASEATGSVLRGARCTRCGAVSFPASDDCAQCGGESTSPLDLPREGVLWTWTTQSVRPPSPPYAGAESAEDYVPFLVGYVQFDGGICVEGRLVGVTSESVRIGAPMRVVSIEYAVDTSGSPLETYVFSPIDGKECA